MDDDFGYDSMDLDGDGYSETLAYDVDGDGYVDAVEVDTDGNGWTDLLVADTDDDGVADSAFEEPELATTTTVYTGEYDSTTGFDSGTGFSTGNTDTDAVLGYINNDVGGTAAEVDATIEYVQTHPEAGIAPPGTGGGGLDSGISPLDVHDKIVDDITDQQTRDDALDAARDSEMAQWKNDQGYPSGPYDDMMNDGSIMY